mgnify:CR=1 FL=1
MNLFYTNNILNKTLSIDESKHCINSLRKNVNDEILITDGKGKIYTTKIIEINKNQVVYGKLNTQDIQNKKITLEIAIAPTKNRARFEWFLEKSTEIGVDAIYPIICQRSERKTINLKRCKKILIAAMKQSKNMILPKIHELTTFKEFIKTKHEKTYIAHCHNTKKKVFKTVLKKENKNHIIRVLIGPEGDFSEEEITLAQKNGIESITLGKNRFRTETAAIVVCNTIQILF